MNKPNFTPEELWIINYYKTKLAGDIKFAVFKDLALVLPSAGFVGTGVYYDSMPAMIIGFGLFALFKIRETYHSAKCNKIIQNIIAKYETAFPQPKEVSEINRQDNPDPPSEQ